MLKKALATLLLVSIVFASACGKTESEGNIGEVKLEVGDTYAVISVRNFGDITVKLYPELAPIAVARFIENAESGYFRDKIFHRVIADFMIQGGSYDGTGMSDPDKASYEVEANNELRHFYGALSVCSNVFGENGDQFYIVSNKNDTYKAQKSGASIMKENIKLIEKKLLNLQSYINSSELSDVDRNSYIYSYKAYQNERRHTAAALEMFEYKSDEVAEKYAEVGGAAHLDGGYTVMGQTVDGFKVIDAIQSVPVVDSLPVDEVIIDNVVIKIYE